MSFGSSFADGDQEKTNITVAPHKTSEKRRNQSLTHDGGQDKKGEAFLFERPETWLSQAIKHRIWTEPPRLVDEPGDAFSFVPWEAFFASKSETQKWVISEIKSSSAPPFPFLWDEPEHIFFSDLSTLSSSNKLVRLSGSPSASFKAKQRVDSQRLLVKLKDQVHSSLAKLRMLNLPLPQLSPKRARLDIMFVSEPIFSASEAAAALMESRDILAAFDRVTGFMVVHPKWLDDVNSCELDLVITRELIKWGVYSVAPALGAYELRAEADALAASLSDCSDSFFGAQYSFIQAHPEHSVVHQVENSLFYRWMGEKHTASLSRFLLGLWYITPSVTPYGEFVRSWNNEPDIWDVLAHSFKNRIQTGSDLFDMLLGFHADRLGYPPVVSKTDLLSPSVAAQQNANEKASDGENSGDHKGEGYPEGQELHRLKKNVASFNTSFERWKIDSPLWVTKPDWELDWPFKTRRLLSAKPLSETGASYILVHLPPPDKWGGGGAGGRTGERDSPPEKKKKTLRAEMEWEDYFNMRWAYLRINEKDEASGLIRIPSKPHMNETGISIEYMQNTSKIVLIGMHAGDSHLELDPDRTSSEPHAFTITLGEE